MPKEKKLVHKVQMTDGQRNIIQQLLQEYDIQSAEDIQDARSVWRQHQRNDGNADGGTPGLRKVGTL